MNTVSMLLRLLLRRRPRDWSDEEIIRVIGILNRRTKNNPVLIGEPALVRQPKLSRGLSSENC